MKATWPSVSENFPWFWPGYGFNERSFLGMSNRCEYAGYIVEAYDDSTRKRIA